MKTLFWLNLKRALGAFLASQAIFFAGMLGIQKTFGIAPDRMLPWTGLSTLACLLYFGGKSKDCSFRFSDQWLLLLPEPRSRLIRFSWISSVLYFLLGALNVGLCIFAHAYLYEPGVPLHDLSWSSVHWDEIRQALSRAFELVVLARRPAITSTVGAVVLVAAGLFVFGSSKMRERQLLLARPGPATPALSRRNYLKLFGATAAMFAVGGTLFHAPYLIPWVLLALFALGYPQMLATTFALSKRASRHFAFVMVQGPALAFAAYFAGTLLVHGLSKEPERREIASIYTHKLIGETIMPERRKLRLAEPALKFQAADAIRSEYHDATGSWYYGEDFPVSFQDAIRTKIEYATLGSVLVGFDTARLTDADAAAYLERIKSLWASGRDYPKYPQWSRFHPSEELTLKLLSSHVPLERSFGIFTAINAPASAKIRAALVRAGQAPDIRDTDLVNLAHSLSVQYQKPVTIAWALRADPAQVLEQAIPPFDCASFRNKTWKEACSAPNHEAFFNVCLRDYSSRKALDVTQEYYYYGTMSREWVEAKSFLDMGKIFTEWKKQAGGA